MNSTKEPLSQTSWRDGLHVELLEELSQCRKAQMNTGEAEVCIRRLMKELGYTPADADWAIPRVLGRKVERGSIEQQAATEAKGKRRSHINIFSTAVDPLPNITFNVRERVRNAIVGSSRLAPRLCHLLEHCPVQKFPKGVAYVVEESREGRNVLLSEVAELRKSDEILKAVGGLHFIDELAKRIQEAR